VSNPPVSASQVAASARFHQRGCFEFLQREHLVQELLLNSIRKKIKSYIESSQFICQYRADKSRLTEQSRTELAKFLIEKASQDFAENISNFALSNESDRLELAHMVAAKAPAALAENIQNFAFTNESDRLKLAHMVAAKAPAALAENIQNFALSNESDRLELARMVAAKAPAALIKNIENFALSNESDRLELAHMVDYEAQGFLAKNIQSFALSNESNRLELAQRIADHARYSVGKYIQNFALSQESDRFELACMIVKYNIEEYVQNFELSESNRLKLAHMVSKTSISPYIQNFALSKESDRIELAREIAEIDPDSLVSDLQNFAISDEEAQIELAQILIRECLSDELISCFEKLQISNQSTKGHLYASVYLGLIFKGEMRATDEKWVKQFFPDDSEPMPLPQVAEQFGNPVIAELLKAPKQLSGDPHIQETLSTWAQLVSLRFAKDQVPEAAWQHLEAPLKAIQNFRAPATRYVLTHLLAQQCLPPAAKDADAFFAFSKPFAKTHTRLYPVLLFPLFQSALNHSALDKLKALLKHSEFKDAKRQKAMVNALIALVQATHLSDGLKLSLLEAALPGGSDPAAARSLAETAPLMECLVSFAQKDIKLGERALQRLQSIRNPGDFNKQVNGMLKDLFPKLSNARNVAAHFNRYREHARHPTGVLSYAAKMLSGLAGKEKASVLAAIGQFVNATVLAPEPESAFRELRYNAAQSLHLRLLADKAPAAFAQWQQPCVYQPSAAFLAQTSDSAKQTDIAAYLKQRIVMDEHVNPGTYPLLEKVLTGQKTLASALKESERQTASATGVEADLLRLLEEGTPVEQKAELITQLLAAMPQGQFRQDLTDLKIQLTPSVRQDNKQFSVIDTDAAEDLFLCGTEVLGSCQNIQGTPNLNKALMGYVLDGKYRMLAIKSEDERLMGRRMLRLLWDEQTQRPVLHLERLYHNPGISEKYEQALVELAQQKARQMECVLVSHDAALPSGGDYPAPLIAHPTPCPFEYVDAEELRVQAGKEGYQLLKARIVASPPK